MPVQVACPAATKPQVITMSDPAKKSLDRTANACHRVGWLSFWAQLSLSVVSAGILLFSVAFTSQVTSRASPKAAVCHGCCTTSFQSGHVPGALLCWLSIQSRCISCEHCFTKEYSPSECACVCTHRLTSVVHMQNGPSVTLYLTLFGIGASFLSTFWAYQYTRLAKRLRLYATRGPQGAEGRLTKASVRKQLWQVQMPCPSLQELTFGLCLHLECGQQTTAQSLPAKHIWERQQACCPVEPGTSAKLAG